MQSTTEIYHSLSMFRQDGMEMYVVNGVWIMPYVYCTNSWTVSYFITPSRKPHRKSIFQIFDRRRLDFQIVLVEKNPNSPILPKYQGVQEFHMLARIGCYCKYYGFQSF